MLYSSGTTGRPKGVKPLFKNEPLGTLSPLLQLLVQKMCGVNEHSVYLSPAPLYHAAPLRFNMMVGALGGTSVIMERFDPEEYLRLVEKYRCTQTQLVPTMFVRMLKLPDEVRAKYDVSSLKAAVHAAAPCPVEVKQKMIDWWGPIFIEYYAGTEGNGVTIANTAEWLAHRGTVGRSLVGPIHIVGEDDGGMRRRRDRPGLFFRRPGVRVSQRPGQDPGRVQRARAGRSLGDVGYLDADGYLYLTDRRAYMIISGGVNIYPQEAENVLVNHPAVADVAVFGVPNEEMGEEVKAVVQASPGFTPGQALADELIVFCRASLSPIKCPRSIDFRAELPRTPTGKLLKRILREQYWPKKGSRRPGTDGTAHDRRNSPTKEVLRCAQRRKQKRKLRRRRRQRTLHSGNDIRRCAACQERAVRPQKFHARRRDPRTEAQHVGAELKTIAHRRPQVVDPQVNRSQLAEAVETLRGRFVHVARTDRRHHGDTGHRVQSRADDPAVKPVGNKVTDQFRAHVDLSFYAACLE